MNKKTAIPFKPGVPIRNPAEFVGRGQLLRHMSNAMLNLQHVSLRGERRTGKTSLLLYLNHPDTLSVLGLDETHVPVYFDFQNCVEATATNVWRELANTIAEKIHQCKAGGPAAGDYFIETVEKFLSAPKAHNLFGPTFGRAFTILKDYNIKIHLLFDEFEHTTRNPELGEPFYDALRGLPTRAENISYIIATREGLTKLPDSAGKISSPFFNIFTSETTELFTEAEVYRMIFNYFVQADINITLAEKLCAEAPFLYDLTGYHPFFLQVLCYHLCSKIDSSDWLGEQHKQESLQTLKKNAEEHFEFYWKNSSREEQELFSKLAFNLPVDWEQIEIRMVLKNLKDRCLIVKAREPEFKNFFSSLFRQWVKNKVVLVKDKSRIDAYVKPPRGPRKISNAKILLVENDSSWQDVLKTLLEGKYELQIASTYQDALKKLKKCDLYNLLIININLLKQVQHDRLGIKILSYIKDSDYQVPCIVITGDTDAPVRQLYERYNVRDIFIKGHFSLDRLLGTIDEEINTSAIQPHEEFLNFLIHISPDGLLRVFSGEGGRTIDISTSIPDTVHQISELVAKIQEEIKTLGIELYNLIFTEPIQTIFIQTEAMAQNKFQKVRIQVTVENDELASLPWELIYNAKKDYFFGVNTETILSRYINLPMPPKPVRRREGPLRMLIIIGNHNEQNSDKWEQILLTDVLVKPLKEKKVVARIIKQATRKEITDALFEQKPDIVQFIGDGIYQNEKSHFALVDSEKGGTWAIDSTQFANLFKADDHLRLVSIMPCENAKSESIKSLFDIAPQIVKKGIPAVVTMQYGISLSVAKIFLNEFYKALFVRKPVDWAVQWARNIVFSETGLDNFEFAAPVLYTRARDGNLFERRGSVKE